MDIDSNVELVKADVRGFVNYAEIKENQKAQPFAFAIDAHGLCIKNDFYHPDHICMN